MKSFAQKISTIALVLITLGSALLPVTPALAQSPGATCTGSFSGPTLFAGGAMNFSMNGNFNAGPPSSPPMGPVTFNVDVSAVGSGVVSGNGSAFSNTGSAGATFVVKGVSAGTGSVSVNVNGSGPWSSCNSSQSYPVTVKAGPGETLSAVYTKTGLSYHAANNGGPEDRNIPAGTVACGMQAGGLDNKGTTKITKIIACPLTPEAIARGFSIGAGHRRLDGDFNDNLLCDQANVLRGAVSGVYNGGSSQQLDSVACDPVFGASLGSPVAVSPGPNGDFFCPADSIVIGVGDAPSKNDSWNRFYCGKVLFVPTLATVTGVNVVCTPSSIQTGDTSQCTATVTGTGSFSTAVTWSIASGNGTINSSGLYSAPGSPTVATVKATSVQDPTKSDTATVTVTAGTAGNVNVTSQNAANAQPVTATWNFAGSVVDPCGGVPTVCAGTARSYNSQPAGSAADIYVLNPGTAPTGYALRSVEKHIAQAAPKKNPILAFVSNLFLKAEASVVCGFINTNPSSCPVFSNTFALTRATDVANFIILWDPKAAISIVPSPLALNSGTLSRTVTISNTGSAGSSLTWTASAPSYSGPGGGWLTVSPTTGAGVVVGSPDSANFTANPGSLAAGTYTATVVFSGTSNPGNRPISPNTTLTVNFTVGSSAPPGSPVDIVSITPSPTVPVTEPITAKCTGGSGSYTWSATGPAIFSSNTGSTFVFSYSTPSSPTYTITCADANDPTNTASVPVTITQVTPVCSFTATPTQIVLPGSSSLSWSCIDADGGCNINGTSVNPISGTLSVSPTSNTTYTLICAGPGSGPGSTSSFQSTVRVVGPGVIEVVPPPN